MKRVLNFLVLLLICSTAFYSQVPDSTLLVWTKDKLPTSGKIRNLTFVDQNLGYALSDNVLITYLNSRWQLFPYQPPLKSILFFEVESPKSIWLTGEINTYESVLLHFNGEIWNKIEHPIMNQIRSADVSNEIKYFGGDREIAVLDNGKWSFLDYPNTPRACKKILNHNNVQYFFSDYGNIFRRVNGKWEQILENYFIHDIQISNDSLFFVNTNNLISLSQQNFKPIFTSDEKIISAEIIDSKNFIVITELNKIYILKNGNQQVIPFQEKIYDVEITSNIIWLLSARRQLLKNKKNEISDKTDNGISFTPQNPITFFYELQNEYGVAITDLNNDGLKDIYSVCIIEANRAYLNLGFQSYTGLFKDEASSRGLTGITGDTLNIGMRELYLSAGVADIDNDKDKDIYLCDLIGANKLLLNDGTGQFRNVSHQSDRATSEASRTNSAVYADVDLDGDLDMFITNEYESNKLYLNDGNGYFTDITSEVGLTTKWGGMTASFADFDNDNDPDLCVTNWGMKNLLYENVIEDGELKFIDISEKAGIAGESFAKSNAVVWADINNDGLLDLFITNRKTSNNLFINNGDKTFSDKTAEFDICEKDLSYGASFADFDNDGFDDLYVANIGENKIYKNIEGKKFQQINLIFEKESIAYSTGTATGDLDNDGDIDLYVASYVNGGSKILLNNSTNHNFVKVNVYGTISNSDAVGTKVYLEKFVNNNYELVKYLEVCAGGGYASFNSNEIILPIDSTNIYRIKVYFPVSQITKYVEISEVGKTIEIYEEGKTAASLTYLNKQIKKLLSDRELLIEETKFLLFIILMIISVRRTRIKLKWLYRNIFALHITCFIIYVILAQIFLFDEKIILSLMPLLASILYLGIIHLYFEKIILAKNADKERKVIRENIARDLHDDLASTISSAAIYSDFLSNNLRNNENQLKIANKLKDLMREAANSISETIWVVSTSKDNLLDLINHIVDYVKENSTSIDLEPIVQLNLNDNDVKIDSRIKRNVFLIIKEAFNNSIKYSQTKKILLKIDYDKKDLVIKLQDFGNGFNFNKESINSLDGNGIKNMHKRAEEIRGDLTIKSKVDYGTSIIFSFKLTQTGY